MKNKVDLCSIAGRVYVGRPRGKSARNYFKIEEYEREKSFPITVIFPSNAKTLASSFFLGMFGESVRQAGSREEFLKRFKFEASKQILSEIDVGISEALSASE
ncbi:MULTISPECIES: hypothetical protein [Vibrio]|uniref:hypothetical protein n=1 Tax=Vibrio TaxID=662 RepID=UPI0003601B84|nr:MULTISPECIES: hypothetical protein [Vibrio]OCH59068.1 hypothetical protein A6D94_20615 [Vibrio splendidus]TKF14483.1 hypothetical protein FCV43_19560 [Vibrio genomosp. F6]